MTEQTDGPSPYAQTFGAAADEADRRWRQDKRTLEAPVLEGLKGDLINAMGRSCAAQLEERRLAKRLAMAQDLSQNGSVNVNDQKYRMESDMPRPISVTTNYVDPFCAAVNAFLQSWGSPLLVRVNSASQGGKLDIILSE